MSSAIPQGSTILVTGINGYIGSHVAEQIIIAGYKVRGTARSHEKAAAVKSALESRYGTGKLEIVIVEDMQADGAYDAAVKGVSGVAHVASNMSFDENPNNVIPSVLDGIKEILKSAANESSVKRFVYTSSSTAALYPVQDKKITVTKDSWNDQSITDAWAPPPYESSRRWAVYGASKTQAEKEVWIFVEKEKPRFVTNTVLPNANFGPLIDPAQGSTANWVLNVYNGNPSIMTQVPPQWFVDVRDTARLHLAALTNPEVQNERIFAFAEPFNGHALWAAIRAARPDHELPEDPTGDEADLSIIAERPRAEALLKEMGRDGFTSLERSIADMLPK